MKATKVNAGLVESNGRLLPGIWRDSLHVTCGLTACTPGSALGPTLSNEYGKTLPLPFYGRISVVQESSKRRQMAPMCTVFNTWLLGRANPQGISFSLICYLAILSELIPACPAHAHKHASTHTTTTERASSVAIGRIYAMHAMPITLPRNDSLAVLKPCRATNCQLSNCFKVQNYR